LTVEEREITEIIYLVRDDEPNSRFRIKMTRISGGPGPKEIDVLLENTDDD
jgi:hypothetical protein